MARALIVRPVPRFRLDLTVWALLRELGRLHILPGDDVGAQKDLAQWLGRPAPLDCDGVRRAVEKWRPYAGRLYFHLLLDGLSKAGFLEIAWPRQKDRSVP